MHDQPTTRMDPTRERALVARARVDAAAFGELYDFYLPRILGFVTRRIADRAAAEDVTAVAFERALAAVRREDFRNEAFGGFLYRVAANAAVDHGRRARWTVPFGIRASDLGDELEPDEGPGDDAALAAFGAAIDRDVLRRALERLPAGHRRVVVLRYLDQLEPDELAAVLGCSTTTASVRLHRALRALRDLMVREDAHVA